MSEDRVTTRVPRFLAQFEGAVYNPAASQEAVLNKGFRVGPWVVDPGLNSISRNGVATQLEPKVMEVLMCLARHTGETLPKEKLLDEVWPGTFVSDDSLKRCILELRRVFEDDAREPRVIQTVSKRGYRLVAPVEPLNGEPGKEDARDEDITVNAARIRSWRIRLPVLAGVMLLMVLLTAFNLGRVRRWFGTSTGPQIHSIAVLPLRNLSSDPNQEYFSDGLTDALIADLARVDSLTVISHTSTVQYKDSKKTLPEIARELNVDGVIEGTVQRSGDRVRITVQLIHGPSDKHVWANSYERDVRDVFSLERDVTDSIAREVQARLATSGQILAQPRAVEPEVLDAYLQGNYHLNRYGKGSGQEEQAKAAQYFQKAIDADRNFAPAYVGLASAHKELLLSTAEDVAIRKTSLERAIELDANNSEAHAWLGWLKWQPFLDWQGAEGEFRRAIAVGPNNADAHGLLGLLLVTLGRTSEGLRECQIAQQLDPNQNHMSFALYLAHAYDRSIAMLRMMLQKDPDNGEHHSFLFQNYMEKHMSSEAVQELAQSYSLFGVPEVADKIRRAYENAGFDGSIQEWANEVERLQSTHRAFLPGNLATAYAILGNKDRALYWLEQAYQHREMVSVDGGVYFLPADPKYDALHSDPRYKELLRRMSLPQQNGLH